IVNAVVNCSVSDEGTSSSPLPVLRSTPFPLEPVVQTASLVNVAVLLFPDQSAAIAPDPSLKAYSATGDELAEAVRNVHVASAASPFPLVSRTPVVPPFTHTV